MIICNLILTHYYTNGNNKLLSSSSRGASVGKIVMQGAMPRKELVVAIDRMIGGRFAEGDFFFWQHLT
jgi:hypothetical protein